MGFRIGIDSGGTFITHTQEIHRVIKAGLVLDPEVLLEENLEQFGARGERHFDRNERN